MTQQLDIDALTFLDPAVQECPFPAYALLQEEAPVFFDRRAGFYIVTRYDDIRRVVTDPATFSSGARTNDAGNAIRSG